MPDTSSYVRAPLALSLNTSANNNWRAHWFFLRVLVRNEIRLRSRRWSSLAAVFLIMLVCWNMIVDPASGMSMMTINERRTLYTSSAIALGSASLLGVILMFAGFYLIRGRVLDDLRCGMAHVIAASPLSNHLLLLSRAIAGVIYFMLLAYTGMFSVMVLQAVRGEPGIQFMTYLQTYSLVFLPLACYVVSLCLLFDSVPRLMGKLGDLLFFILWCLQLSLLALIIKPTGETGLFWFTFDFNGLMTLILSLQEHTHTSQISIGASNFDPALSALVLPDSIWHFKFMVLRAASAVVAMLPLVLAIAYFHRYSPDRLGQGQIRQRRSLIGFLNDFFQPARALLRPVSKLSLHLPGPLATVFAEMLVSLQSAPFLLLLLAGLSFSACILPLSALATLLKFLVLAWSMLIADIASRDFQSGMQTLTAVHHGAVARYVRQVLAGFGLAVLFGLPLFLRIAFVDSVLLGYALMAFGSVAVLAGSLGSISGTPRLFVATFLLWFYFATQATKLSQLDLFGFNHVADRSTLLVLSSLALGAFLSGYVYNRWKNA